MRVLMQARAELDRGGALIPVDITGIVDYFVDTKYGEDADGNRGEKRTIVDEVVEINAWDDDVKALALTQKEEDFLADLLTKKFLGE